MGSGLGFRVSSRPFSGPYLRVPYYCIGHPKTGFKGLGFGLPCFGNVEVASVGSALFEGVGIQSLCPEPGT